LKYLEDYCRSFWLKRIKADFKKLGPKFGKQMKQVAGAIAAMNQDAISKIRKKS